ncbi:lipase (class 3) [Larkinella arboricola]|uniref:Lipase (Class 3) n=1 Tax=Larkinella arboricola TaxID=643671 RepID=A0A327WNS2_LARAB|nr:lipase [Larkinella arboricola]RAJ93245.1 lipase (class 3) [Larkinella arboricola]
MKIPVHAKPISPRLLGGLPYSVAVILLGVITLAACSDDHRLPPVKETSLTDTHKQIALLCMLSNVNYDLIAASQEELRQNTLKINDLLQNNADVRAYIGTDWQVVWGPEISNSRKKSSTSAVDSFVTDNTMYVARGTDLATGKTIHVVAIAGTNAVSRKGAILEDFNVLEEKDWGAPASGKISAGSAVGFNILSSMRDGATGKTLLEFLATLGDAGPTEVAFTGHSLGGALSPLMALKCIEWTEQMGYTNITISVYPIAGPTPGNKEFAIYAAQKFGKGYHSVINEYDIVPHSWQKDMFEKIPSLYKNAPPFNPGGNQGFGLPLKDQLAFNGLKAIIDQKTYQRIAPEREFVFQGRANVYADGSGSFFKEAKYQHVLAYYKDAFEFPQSIMDVLSN